MTRVVFDAPCMAAQAGAPGVPGAMPLGPVSRQAVTFRYTRACGADAGCGHAAQVMTAAAASTVPIPAASQPRPRLVFRFTAPRPCWLARFPPLRAERNALRPAGTGSLTGILTGTIAGARAVTAPEAAQVSPHRPTLSGEARADAGTRSGPGSAREAIQGGPQGAVIAIRLASLSADGPTGKVFEDDAQLTW
jgi:hypothetical protein